MILTGKVELAGAFAGLEVLLKTIGYYVFEALWNKTNVRIKMKYESVRGYIMKKRKKKRPTIYFAHPFDRMGSKREEMIERILEERGYEVVNPFKKEIDLNAKYGVNNYYENPTKEFAEDIVVSDYKLVADCDEYFGWFPKGVTMIGTPLELAYAMKHKKKITVLCYKAQPFLWYHANVFYLGYDNFVKGERFE